VLLVDEARLRRHTLARWGETVRALGTWATPRILAIFIFASGALLLYSGATPGVPSRLAWLAGVMPLPLLEASHFTASLTGLLLLLLAQAIGRRADAAFYVTGGALIVGIAASLLKGADYEEAIVLALVLAALVAARRHFTRRARVFARWPSRGWLAAVATVIVSALWLGSFAYRHVAYAGDLWWRFAVDGDAPRFLRASVGVTVAALTFAVTRLLRPALPDSRALDADALRDITRVIAHQPHTMPMLVYLGDKQVLWNDDRTGFVMYAVRGHSCVALGDPVGPPCTGRDLIARFLDMCHEVAALPVFYEASSERLSDFADVGLTAVKIGEEARVPLAAFSLTGSAFKTLRSPMNRLDREGFVFRMVDEADVAPLLPQLAEISDEWLGSKTASEKGFSVGYFNEAYLKRCPLAVIERDGRIEAFANLWTGASRHELSADLMRHRDGAPSAVMDALFAHLMLWGRGEGYEWFNLGMAPLAGLLQPPAGRAWARIGRFIYAHGEAFYNFQGLRAYKTKFNPVWQPRYLVYPGGFALARVAADVASLIAGGYVRMFLRPGRRAA
jgi:phosphatidylglycerol lysyltransferase